MAAPRAALHSMGCRLNHAETAVLQSSLEQAGYRIVPWGEPAELLVLNSCTVTGASDAKGRQALRAMRRRFPGARLALLGCY
ncbi:MAG TPA: tRNA (N(6)-L-threonylcarbamoyladenosine(37)-C(2))-methylthiotransferase MtaB, partial [bacterium]